MEELDNISEDRVGSIEHYNPVNVHLVETTGIVALAVIALILLFALLRAQKEIRELLRQQNL